MQESQPYSVVQTNTRFNTWIKRKVSIDGPKQGGGDQRKPTDPGKWLGKAI